MSSEDFKKLLISVNVADYARDYEFRGDYDYKPNDNEQTLIEDAIHGFLHELEMTFRN